MNHLGRIARAAFARAGAPAVAPGARLCLGLDLGPEAFALAGAGPLVICDSDPAAGLRFEPMFARAGIAARFPRPATALPASPEPVLLVISAATRPALIGDTLRTLGRPADLVVLDERALPAIAPLRLGPPAAPGEAGRFDPAGQEPGWPAALAALDAREARQAAGLAARVLAAGAAADWTGFVAGLGRVPPRALGALWRHPGFGAMLSAASRAGQEAGLARIAPGLLAGFPPPRLAAPVLAPCAATGVNALAALAWWHLALPAPPPGDPAVRAFFAALSAAVAAGKDEAVADLLRLVAGPGQGPGPGQGLALTEKAVDGFLARFRKPRSAGEAAALLAATADPAPWPAARQPQILELRARAALALRDPLLAATAMGRRAALDAAAPADNQPLLLRALHLGQRRDAERAAAADPRWPRARHVAICGVSYCGSSVLGPEVERLWGLANVGESHWLTHRKHSRGDPQGSELHCAVCGPECRLYDAGFREALRRDPVRRYDRLAARLGVAGVISSEKNLAKLIEGDPLLRFDAVILFKTPVEAWWSNWRKIVEDIADFAPVADLDAYLDIWTAAYGDFLDRFAPAGRKLVLGHDRFARDPAAAILRLGGLLDLTRQPPPPFGSHFIGGNRLVLDRVARGEPITVTPPRAHGLPADHLDRIARHAPSRRILARLQRLEAEMFGARSLPDRPAPGRTAPDFRRAAS